MSEQINELATALVKVQEKLKPAPKDSTNPFFSSKYSDLSTIIETARNPLVENGFAISQAMDESDGLTAQVTTILMHKSGQWLSSTVTMKPKNADPQGIGSAITYARRYAYAAIIGLASEADDDGNSASAKTETTERNGTTVTKPVGYQKASCEQCGTEVSMNVKSFSMQNYGKVLCMEHQKTQK